MTKRVLVLEDDESLRLVITKALTRAGFEVRATASPDTAIDRMVRQDADALVADVLLGQENFLDRVAEITRVRPNSPIIVMSAQTTVATALNADERGAFEYLPKPFDINVLVETLDRALHRKRSEPKRSGADLVTFIGQSNAMQAAFRAIARLSRSTEPVLITGPDGSGRASAARVIHEQSSSRGALVEAGPSTFAGSMHDLWAEARGGTLILRRAEVWSGPVQAFIREALEGSVRDAPRLIATAGEAVADSLEPALLDLLAVGFIQMPPLYRRGGDRALLFEAFLKMGKPPLTLTDEARAFVNAQAWPGEVLQLKRTAKQIMAQGPRGPVDPAVIEAAMSGPTQTDPDGELEAAAIRYFAASREADASELTARAQASMERGLIRAALESAGGVRQEAARRIGMNRNTFARKLDQFGLADED
jgi:two-component system nitrogen regulation response regulator GlnG